MPKWNVESHLEFMNAAEIDFTILSMATPHISDKSAAREINIEFAELCRRFPKRFGFVATLPLPQIEGSIEEFHFATEKLGALVIIHPSPARLLPREGVVTGKVMALFDRTSD